jgi:hypothetical protein
MKHTRFMILGMLAAAVLAVTATASTYAAGTTFEKLDWAAVDLQQYGSPGALPSTGDGTGLADSDSTRGWAIAGIAGVAAMGIAGASVFVLRSKRFLR